MTRRLFLGVMGLASLVLSGFRLARPGRYILTGDGRRFPVWGDGRTDDSENVQRAIDYAMTLPMGQRIINGHHGGTMWIQKSLDFL